MNKKVVAALLLLFVAVCLSEATSIGVAESEAIEGSMSDDYEGEVLHRPRRGSCDWGRFGCIPSCMVQNCATGYCGGDGICRCSRCGSGSKFPWWVPGPSSMLCHPFIACCHWSLELNFKWKLPADGLHYNMIVLSFLLEKINWGVLTVGCY